MPPAQSQPAVCRTCLAPGRLVPIFRQEPSAADYSELILTHSEIKVERNDGYPQEMCFACLQLLKSAAYFRKIARQSDDKLRGVHTSVLAEDDSAVKTEPDSVAVDSDRLKSDNSKDGDTSDSDGSGEDLADSDSDSSVSAKNDQPTGATSRSEEPENKKKIDKIKAKEVKMAVEKRKSELRSMVRQIRRKGEGSSGEAWQDIAKIVVKTEPKIINRGDKEWRTRVRAIFRVSGGGGGGGSAAARHIECRLCGITLKQQSSMHVHAQKHLGYRVICEACGKGFPNNCALQQHCMNRHGLKKSFSCPHCPFTSAVKFELTVHERTHTGERPFICDTCGSSFYRRRCLIVHTRSHSDTRPYKCTNCEKRFISRGDMLAHHNAVHQRRYVFPCPVCGHTYARRTTVYKHVAAQHDVRVDRDQVTKIFL